jgi:peroxiredoxin
VQFIGVAWYGDDTSFQGFVDKYSLSFPQISDNPGDVFARFNVPQQPAMAIIDSAGAVQVSMGAVEESALDAALTRAVGA